MNKLAARTLAALISFLAIGAFANETEAKLQKLLERRIDKLTVAVKQFDSFEEAYKATPSDQREAVLRKICHRMKTQTNELSTAIDAMDTYLAIQAFSKQDQIELQRTQKHITNLKSQIQELKRDLGSVNPKDVEVASK